MKSKSIDSKTSITTMMRDLTMVAKRRPNIFSQVVLSSNSNRNSATRTDARRKAGIVRCFTTTAMEMAMSSLLLSNKRLWKQWMLWRCINLISNNSMLASTKTTPTKTAIYPQRSAQTTPAGTRNKSAATAIMAWRWLTATSSQTLSSLKVWTLRWRTLTLYSE